MSGSYESRFITMVANIPIALPPALQYVVLSASVNSSALGITIGDGNGDFTAWPAGLTIKFDRSVPARLISSVTQSVAIGFTDGGVTLVDSRNVPIGPTAATIIDGGDVALGARADAAATTDGGTFSLIALIKRLLSKTGSPTAYGQRFTTTTGAASAQTTVVLVAGGANVNGVLVQFFSLACGADPVAFCSIGDSSNTFGYVYDSQAISHSPPGIIIPAANAFQFTTRGKCTVAGAYTVL